MQTLLDITGFSLSKLERSFRKVFQMTPQQVLTRLRIQMAMHLLHGDEASPASARPAVSATRRLYPQVQG